MDRAIGAWVWRTLALETPSPAQRPANIVSLSAESCRPCHLTQYEDWSRSAMGRAMTDPIFLADYQSQGELFLCISCHAPLLEQQPSVVTGIAGMLPLRPIASPNERFDSALQREGVTCVSCHLRDGVLVGPDGDLAPHETRKDPHFREAVRCVRCHQVPIPPLTHLDRPIADTHGEWARWQAATGRQETCTDCHMPQRRHTWLGAFDRSLLREGLGVSVSADAEYIEVTLENRAGHNFPSAEPSRALVVRAGSEEIVLARRVPLPKMRDLGDTTLLPGETRTVRLPRAPGVDEIEVVMQPVRFLPVDVQPIEIEIARIALPPDRDPR